MAFKKGESGNPGGRPKKDNLASLEARKYAIQAINVYVKNLASENETVAKQAADALLERGFGKPQEYIEIDQETTNKSVSDEVAFKRLMSFGIDPQLILKAFSPDDDL